MKLIKRLSKKQYKGKDNKEHRFVNYYLELDNGKRVIVKCVDKEDYKIFDAVAVYERSV